MENKEEAYIEVVKQISSVVADEPDFIANLSNTVAILKTRFNFWWVGFYLVKEGQLVLGPFQGPVACTRIDFGKGVCGTSWKENRTLVVPNVHEFEGHIACSAESNSEIVVPIVKDNKVMMVLDIDSKEFNEFDHIDQKYLEEIAVIMARLA